MQAKQGKISADPENMQQDTVSYKDYREVMFSGLDTRTQYSEPKATRGMNTTGPN